MQRISPGGLFLPLDSNTKLAREADGLTLAGAVHAGGVEGFLRDKTCKSGTPPVPEKKARKLVKMALSSPPHKVRQFKVSTGPEFAKKTHDVIALYMNLPDHAVVLSINEKTQIQALGRTQKGLPMKPGRATAMTHEDKRNGTTTLFAALNILDGTIIELFKTEVVKHLSPWKTKGQLE